MKSFVRASSAARAKLRRIALAGDTPCPYGHDYEGTAAERQYCVFVAGHLGNHRDHYQTESHTWSLPVVGEKEEVP